MKHFILSRFHLFEPAYFSSSGRSNDQILEHIYSETRLTYRLNLFERMCLPSVINQNVKADSWRWNLYTSHEIPAWFEQRVLNLISDFKNIELIKVSNGLRGMKLHLDTIRNLDTPYSTIRLDDDDALNTSLLSHIETHHNAPIYEKKVISFPLGRAYTVEDTGVHIHENPIFKKMIALGLTGINMEIHSAGNHRKIEDRGLSVVEDYSLKDAYFLHYSDSMTQTQRAESSIRRDQKNYEILKTKGVFF